MPRLDPLRATGNPAHLSWRKSSRSLPGDDCVEAARLSRDLIGVRDSKDAVTGPVVAVTLTQWRRLLAQIKQGRHDLP
ncbi:DUF397 domain-containing protein [Actinomadura keratinilytica]|uniref:DUF397 domain-containing protein n=1 Tax=Actinomadura keratinilytica TaxID=547461 RepID=A0ABP7ZHL9_9ACTN